MKIWTDRRTAILGTAIGTILLIVAFVMRRMTGYTVEGLHDKYKHLKLLTPYEAYAFSIFADTVYPGDHSINVPSATEAGAVEYFDHYINRLGGMQHYSIRALIHVMEHIGLVYGNFTRTSDLSEQDRIELFDKVASGPYLVRSLSSGFRTMLAFCYWHDERVRVGIGTYRKCPNWAGSMMDEIEVL